MQLSVSILRNSFYGFLHSSITWTFKEFEFAFVISLQGEKCNSEKHKKRKRRGNFQNFHNFATKQNIL